MKVLNDKGTDLSEEVYIHMMVMMLDVWDDVLACNMISRALEAEFHNETFFSKKLKAFRKTKVLIDMLREHLEKEFDPKFDEIFASRRGQEVEVTDGWQEHANDFMQMKLIYITKALDNDDKKPSMKKALLNFKGNLRYNLNSILEYWKFKI